MNEPKKSNPFWRGRLHRLASWYLIDDKSSLGYFPKNMEILNSGQGLDNSSDNEIFTITGQHRVKTASKQ